MSSILVAQTDVGGILKYFSDFHFFGEKFASKRRSTKYRLLELVLRKYWVFRLWGVAPYIIYIKYRRH